jgi:hypothetical protein
VAVWIAILFLMLVIFTLVTLRQKAQLEFRYWREGYADSLTVILRGPYGLVFYRAEMSLVDTLLTSKGPALRFSLARKDKLQGADKQTSRPIPISHLGKLKHFITEFLPLMKYYRPVVDTIARHARIEKFSWKTKFGTADAALTGICMGLVWIVIGLLSSLLQGRQTGSIGAEDVEVIPVFHRACFHTSFHCILSIRIVHVITAQFRLLKLKLQQRKR